MTADAKIKIRNLVSNLCLVAVAGVFIYAAQSKIIEPRQFVVAIKNYRMLPEEFLNLMAMFLPWLELVAAVALLVPRTRRAGGVLIIGMLCMFIVAVSYAALYKGYNISCGCFGKGSAGAGIKTIALDTGLIVATIIGLLPRRKVAASEASLAEFTVAGQQA